MSEKAGELVKDLMARYTGREPKTISLKLSWDDVSEIRISGDGLDEKGWSILSPFLSRVSLKA